MQKWIVTGISGSGRIELLQDLAKHARTIGKRVVVHDLGELINEECTRNNLRLVDKKILDVDYNLLRTLRSAAIKEIRLRMLTGEPSDLHLIGVHATFRWKHRLIPGITFREIFDLEPDGFVNVVEDIKKVVETNERNSKWDDGTRPDVRETQEWLAEEEFVTEIMGEVIRKPVYIVARQHTIGNLADLFFSNKRRIYLSYPITAVKETDPGLLEVIQTKYLRDLEERFVVFNPLAIKDMSLTYDAVLKDIPKLVGQMTPAAKDTIKTRTIERDFQFIDQSDAVVVLYMTDKVSPGVLAEIYYAHRNQKPVFMAFPGSASPFIEDATDVIEKDINALMKHLDQFAAGGR
jgi:adenylate kinase